MKKSLIIACAAMLSFAPLASAQFVGMEKSASKSVSTPSAAVSNTTKLNALHVDFLPIKMVSKASSLEASTDYKGFSLGYARLSPLGTAPLFLEWGVDVDFAFWSEKEEKYENKQTLMDLKVPFSLAYKFNIPGSSVGLMPLLGFDLGLFTFGKQTNSSTYNSQTKTTTADLFDSSTKNKRFIFDFHIGAKVLFGESFFVSYRYELPIAKLYSENSYTISVKRHNIGLGFYF